MSPPIPTRAHTQARSLAARLPLPHSPQCDIAVEVREATTSVSLHARELAISEASFTPASGGEAIRAKRISLDVEATVLELEFAKELPQGQGTLKLAYIGQLNNQMAGFYRSTYTNIKGEEKVMASTQFESIDARRAFPCWDEVRPLGCAPRTRSPGLLLACALTPQLRFPPALRYSLRSRPSSS